MSRSFRIAGAAILGALAFAPSAVATPRSRISSVVTYDDLNLNTRAGDLALLARLNHAAVRDCGGAPIDPFVDNFERFDQCRNEAVNQAVHAIGNVELSMVYTQETHPTHHA
ncbi:MAG: UrcA family protein [Hyphomonadaceae bacterium]